MVENSGIDATPHALRRVYGVVTYIDNLLLIPMFTVMVLEMSVRKGGQDLLSFDVVNLWFCVAFLLEWVLGLLVAESRKRYLISAEKILDLVSAIPFGYFFQGLRVARLVRVLRVVRIILRARRFRGRGGRLLRVLGVVGATVFAGALGLRIVEPETVTGLGDSLWWSIITVSTVGYGDIAPKTALGRAVASVLVFVGIGVFGYVAGFMTSLMEDPEEDEILATLRRVEARLDHITGASGW